MDGADQGGWDELPTPTAAVVPELASGLKLLRGRSEVEEPFGGRGSRRGFPALGSLQIPKRPSGRTDWLSKCPSTYMVVPLEQSRLELDLRRLSSQTLERELLQI